MDLGDAWRVIGMSPTADRRRVREAYLALMATTHPDRSADASAHRVTAELTEAYRVVTQQLDHTDGTTPNPADEPAADPATTRRDHGHARPRAHARVTAADTITIDGPADMATALVIDTSHRFGDLLIVDLSAGLIQVAVEFVDGPVCHVLLDLQGRAHDGTTDVFVTVDSLVQQPAPELGAVTEMIAGYLNSSPGSDH